MKKVFFLFLFSNFLFGQVEYENKIIGLPNELQPYELRIYISQDGYLNKSVFILKRVNEHWIAEYYKILINKFEKVTIPVDRGRNLWLGIINTKINKLPSIDDISYKEESDEIYLSENDEKSLVIGRNLITTNHHPKFYSVYINDGKIFHNVLMTNPKIRFYEFPNIDEYQYFFKFLWLIENELKISLD